MENNKAVNVMWGKFAPWTYGHQRILQEIRNVDPVPDLIVGTTCTLDLIPFDMKAPLIERATGVWPSVHKDMWDFAEYLVAELKGVHHVRLWCGQDRIRDFSRLQDRILYYVGGLVEVRVHSVKRESGDISATEARAAKTLDKYRQLTPFADETWGLFPAHEEAL